MSYRVWVDQQAIAEVRKAPGNMRQRIKRAMIALGDSPRPDESRSPEGRPNDSRLAA